jgi:peptidoglycan/LPS O-acetylase OafA/YrhL
LRNTGRFAELDSLRGVAALSVVFLHFVDMFFPWARIGSRTQLQRTVLNLIYPFYAGHEAVMLFFVLSGFVLALPYVSGRQQGYWAFVRRRIVRLYCPYLVALMLAVGGVAIWHGHLGLGDWADVSWSRPVDPKLVLQHVLFVGNYDTEQYNVVFWTLVLEMRISLIFPFLAGLIVRVRTLTALLIAAACPLVYQVSIRAWPASEPMVATIAFIAAFICGILIAQNLQAIRGWYESLARLAKVGLGAGVLVFYTCSHLVPSRVGQVPMLMGAAGLIVIALNSNLARRLLGLAVPRFLGRISYSLYLVHVPVLFALTFALHTRISKTTLFFIYVPTAIGLGTIFNILVEEPFIRLSRRIGRRQPFVNEAVPSGV